jgi:hypothetical protein
VAAGTLQAPGCRGIDLAKMSSEAVVERPARAGLIHLGAVNQERIRAYFRRPASDADRLGKNDKIFPGDFRKSNSTSSSIARSDRRNAIR